MKRTVLTLFIALATLVARAQDNTLQISGAFHFDDAISVEVAYARKLTDWLAVGCNLGTFLTTENTNVLSTMVFPEEDSKIKGAHLRPFLKLTTPTLFSIKETCHVALAFEPSVAVATRFKVTDSYLNEQNQPCGATYKTSPFFWQVSAGPDFNINNGGAIFLRYSLSNRDFNRTYKSATDYKRSLDQSLSLGLRYSW